MPYDIEALASAVASRLVPLMQPQNRTAPAFASAGIERLASAVARELASAGAGARVASKPVDARGLASGLAVRLASKVAPQAVDLASIDAAKLASSVARRLKGRAPGAVDPTELLASLAVQRLSMPGLYAVGPSDPNLVQRVASMVVRNIGKEAEAAPGPGDGKAAAKPK